jgi:hypothetical protein
MDTYLISHMANFEVGKVPNALPMIPLVPSTCELRAAFPSRVGDVRQSICCRARRPAGPRTVCVREARSRRYALEHFQEKWNPVFRPKMRQCKMLERFLSPVYVKPL